MTPATRAAATVRVTCHAPHPDRRRKGDACGRLLGDVPAAVEFVTTADNAPVEPDGTIWLQCPRKECTKWNRFKVVVERGRLV